MTEEERALVRRVLAFIIERYGYVLRWEYGDGAGDGDGDGGEFDRAIALVTRLCAEPKEITKEITDEGRSSPSPAAVTA